MIKDGQYLISEFYRFDIDANLIKESEEKGKPIILSGILQKANTLNRNGRVYPYDILKREADKYMELVTEGSALGECVPAGTEIFTKYGWKNIEDVDIDEDIFTLNIDNNKLEIQGVTDTIKKEYNDDMIHIYNSSNLDMMITKKHKVVLWDRKDNPYILTGEELYNKIINKDSTVSHSYIKNSGIWDGDTPEYYHINDNIKIKTEDWAAFLGIYLAEGHCGGNKGGKKTNIVGITQIKEHSKIKIENLLKKLPFGFEYKGKQFLVKDEYLHKELFNLGNSFTKYIPEYAKNWNPLLLNIMLEWMLLGDGRNRKDRNGNVMREYCTTSPQLSNDVFEIMLKIGSGANINLTIPKDRIIEDRVILAENSKVLYTVHEKTTKGIYLDSRFVNAEKISFNDNVYCISVPNKTWLMKYNNKISWTHNCDHPDSPVVSLLNSSHKVIDMWWQGEELYGKVQLTETNSGNILKGLLKSGVKLGISSRGVGSVKTIKNEDVVQDDFELIAFDFVSSPSTPGAYLFKESRQWGLRPLSECIGISKNVGIKTQNIAVEMEKYEKLFNLYNKEFWKK